jgi:hypothetical protein
MMATKTYSIDPGVIATASTAGAPAFHLSSDQWTAIQTYVRNALALPTTLDQFKNLLGTGAPADLSDFTKLVTLWSQMNTSCANWQSTIFPNTVSLSSDIYEYGSNKAPVYYNAIIAEANVLIAHPDSTDPANQQAAAALKAILDVLQKYATDSQAKAKAVSDSIQAFATEMQGFQTTLSGPDGKGGYQKYYNDEYGSESQEQKSLNDQIAQARDNLAIDQAQYNHDKIVACTTPTYAWIWPVGTIAAAIVAGIYGHKALEDLDNINADNDTINTLSAEIAADANMINALTLANSSIGGMVTAINNALPVVQAIEGAWGSIKDDLGDIATMIDTIMNLGVTSAITAWANVAELANNYRLYAYIGNAPSSVVSMEHWRVKSLIASPAARTGVRAA